jgi:hypothetical protein
VDWFNLSISSETTPERWVYLNGELWLAVKIAPMALEIEVDFGEMIWSDINLDNGVYILWYDYWFMVLIYYNG